MTISATEKFNYFEARKKKRYLLHHSSNEEGYQCESDMVAPL